MLYSCRPFFSRLAYHFNKSSLLVKNKASVIRP